MAPRFYRNLEELAPHWVCRRPAIGQVVFSNGCFDILHAGHVAYLEEARALGDFLVLGLNSDASVSRLKGPKRPVCSFEERALVLSGLQSVDLVVGFEEDTPRTLIKALEPDVLVKGGDRSLDQIVGSELVLARGGLVRTLSFRPGISTSDLVARILRSYR